MELKFVTNNTKAMFINSIWALKKDTIRNRVRVYVDKILKPTFDQTDFQK